ncbi:hypothetical protein Q2T42_05920 [Leptolyngbya boryana CZ1]|uniref:Uncharacterized protein n=1 Tax=Leptolyngbya boryana CZ1 TaxID=3060204 RepID=A0AA96WX62_LEPBY|nr:hypothetical protein [Leptolyngbya boryana]WNZ47370.1 hypothetical protein Q2T42_05920 [Leptolyngbya boryana CZ1]
MTQHDPARDASYPLDRDELLRIRSLKLLTSDRDYVFFALQVDYPGKLTPGIDVAAFCDRWELNEGDLYKALGELQKKGIVVSISDHLNLRLS